jgi:REP element-mobilizing transposase RayT
LNSTKPYTFTDAAEIYFCTDVTIGWQYVFTSIEFFSAIIDSLKYCQLHKGLRLHGYVIMPNHVHTVLSAGDGDLSGVVRDYKRFTSTKISELLQESENNRLLRYFSRAAKRAGRGNTFKIWQAGSQPEPILSHGFFLQKLNYIHENPVRKGFVSRPEHWTYSSARNYYLNDHSVIGVDMLE